MGASNSVSDDGFNPAGWNETDEQREMAFKAMVKSVLPNVDQDGNSSSAFNLDPLSDDFRRRSYRDIVTGEKDETNRPLKDLMTDLVVKEFFSTKETLFNFLSIVYNEFSEVLAIYREARGLKKFDVFFIYKGGNILRIIANEFLLELPNSAISEISKFYAPFFKRSDADFSIYINPDLPSYDDIYYETGLLSYLLQDRLRNIFHANLAQHFDFFRYSSSWQDMLLRSYLDRANKLQGFEGQFQALKVGQPNADVTVRFVDETEPWLKPVRKAVTSVIKQSSSTMTITHNTTLDFPGGSSDFRVRFTLVRTKVFFALLERDDSTAHIGGELIDVSIPHADDAAVRPFFAHLNDKITSYSLSPDANGGRLQFLSYSLPYLTYDLEKILFMVAAFPWEDQKYAKRLNRLFYMGFVDIFIKLEDASEKLKVITEIRDSAFIALTRDADITMLEASLAVLIKKLKPRKIIIVSMLDQIRLLLGRISKSSDWTSNMEQLKVMGGVLVENANVVIDAISKVRQYCSVDGIVKPIAIRKGDISNLV